MLLSRIGIDLIIWQAVFTVLITAVVICRFWAARIKRRALRIDDYLVVLSYISTITLQACTCWGIAYGLGAHMKDVAEEKDAKEMMAVQFKILLSNGVTWLFATVSCKVAIIYFYTVIFSTGRFVIVARTLMGICIAYGVSLLIAFLTNCKPIDYMWNPTPGGHCKDITVEEMVSVSLNMLLDVAIVLLPLPSLWKLHMASGRKLAISFLFSLGLLVSAVMSWRLWLQVRPINKIDYTYAAGVIGLPTFLELWIGIIVACLPTLTPLFSKYIKPVVTSFRSSSYKSSGNSRKLKEAEHTIGGWGPRGMKKYNFDTLDDKSFLDLEEGGKTSSHASSESPYPTAPAYPRPPPYPVAPAPVIRTGPAKSLPETPKIGYEDRIENNNRAIQVRSDVTVYSEPGKW